MTITLLEDELRSNIDERKIQLLSTKTIAFRYAFNEVDEQFFLNYSIPIVYSIWEGFINSAFQSYVREINRLCLSTDVICKQILVFNVESKFKQFKEYPQKMNLKANFFNNLSTFFEDKTVHIFPIINTESNVGFNVLNRILSDFNFKEIPEYPISGTQYSLKYELDKFLLKIRNNVAHGDNSITVYKEDLDRATKLVEYLMDLVVERILTGYLVDKTHLENAL